MVTSASYTKSDYQSILSGLGFKLDLNPSACMRTNECPLRLLPPAFTQLLSVVSKQDLVLHRKHKNVYSLREF